MENILNQIPLPVFIIDGNKKLLEVNQMALQLFGKELDELRNQPCCCFDTEICGTRDCAVERVKRGEHFAYFHRDGRDYKVTTSKLREIEDGYIEVIQDISEVLEIQRLLEEKTLELETISETLAGGILITSLEEGFPVLQCNHGYQELLGISEEELLGKPALQFVFEAQDQFEKDLKGQLDDSREVRKEHQIVRRDGSKLWVSLRGHSTMLNGKQVGVWLLTDISAAKETERILKINEERYRVAIENTSDIIIDYDIEKRSMYHTFKAMEIYGVPELLEDAPESLIRMGVIQEQTAEDYLDIFRKIRAGEEQASCDLKARTADGNLIWNHLAMTTIFDNENKPVRAIGILQDINEEREVLRKYEHEVRYKELTMKDAVLYYEINLTERRFILGHDRLLDAYGLPQTDEYGQVIGLILKYMIYEDDRQLVSKNMDRDALIQAFASGREKVVFEYRRNVGAAEPTWVECTVYLLKDNFSKDICCVVYIKDIDAEKKRIIAFQQKAERDLLTGLYNKITTETLVKKFLESAKSRTGLQGAFILIDLDNFKNINDSFGHAVGDAVLSEVSAGLNGLFRQGDIVGRIGGDEFAAFLPKPHSAEVVEHKVESVSELFRSTHAGASSRCRVSCSIGVALFPQDGETFTQLYENADKALYVSKNKGKDRFSFFHEDMPSFTASAREIDQNSGKLFSENITEYVLRILYETKDMATAIDIILELVSKHFHFDRGYLMIISRDGRWDCRSEWHKKNLPPYRRMDGPFDWNDFSSLGNVQEAFVAVDFESLPKAWRHVPEETGGQVLLFPIRDGGEIRSVIGFQQGRETPAAAETMISTLQQVSMLLALKMGQWDGLCGRER